MLKSWGAVFRDFSSVVRIVKPKYYLQPHVLEFENMCCMQICAKDETTLYLQHSVKDGMLGIAKVFSRFLQEDQFLFYNVSQIYISFCTMLATLRRV